MKGSQLVMVEMTTHAREDAKVILEDLMDTAITNESTKERIKDEGRIKLLTTQITLLQNELDQQISARISEMERDLGKDNVDIYASWNGKRMQLDQYLQEKTRIDREIAGLRQSLESLERDLTNGKTPPEVQTMLSRDGRYLGAKQRLDDMSIVVDQLKLKLGEQHEQVIANKKLMAAYQQKLDSIHEELKDEYSETYQSTLKNQIAAMNANKQVITEAISTLGNDLGKLNEKMTEYAVLKAKEGRYRDNIAKYENERDRIKNLRMATNWKKAEWFSLPTEPDAPSFPKLWITMSVAVMLSLALSLGIAFLRELTDTTVRSPKDIAKVGQLTLLGLIPHPNDDPQAEGSRLHLAILDAPNSHVAEQFRQIRTRLQYAHALDTTRSMLITSPSAEDGKTTVACNLAAALALNGRRILLVDANFRRPQLNGMFNLPNENGFGDVLTDLDRLPDAVRTTDVPNLSVLVAGSRPVNPTELLESQFFIDFIERVLEEYDHVIFDSGPMLMVSESVAMAPRVDGVVTVVRARGNSRGLLQRLRDELRRVKAEHIGVVLNAVRSQGGGYYGRNIKSYYQYENQA
jgi:capsular exopolysaccharide synthesis family protein